MIWINPGRLCGAYHAGMLNAPPSTPASLPSREPGLRRLAPPLPLFLLQPVLARIVTRIAAANPDMFSRLGQHTTARFLIEPVNLPMLLLLRPDPEAPLFQAFPRNREPAHDARISGRFLDLLRLIDGGLDDDALFFSRDLVITGNTEAVVCLRNALDDVEGSIAADVADMFGPPGRAALAGLRRASERRERDR